MMLNAVICVWNEEDIIEATIKHLFAQGCSNVFIIDNFSTDDTVKNAICSGAILADSFNSKYFDELEKIYHLNAVVKNYNDQTNEDHVWWLYIDADEFPNINCNLTIYDFLKSLNLSIRGVHGYMFNHIPRCEPYYIPSHHPIDFQPIATKSSSAKIPLLRYDKNKPHLYSAGGAHTLDTCGELVKIAKDVLNIHHFNYRRFEDTSNRLKLLCQKRSDGTSRVDRDGYKAKFFFNSGNVESAYITRYNKIASIYNVDEYKKLIIESLPYHYKYIVRWYDVKKCENLICQALNYYYNEEYELAMFRFNDLLEVIRDKKLQMFITINIAACLSFSEKKESLELLKSMMKYNDKEVQRYAVKNIQKIKERSEITEIENTVNYSIEQYFGEFKNDFR